MKTFSSFHSILLSTSILAATSLQADRRYSQIIINLESKRPYDYYYSDSDNAVVLKINRTTPEELEALYNYDERLVRRLLLKANADQSTEVRFILKNQNVRATIYSLEEPFRIAIDLFDKNFREARDAKTGLPILSTNDSSGETNLSQEQSFSSGLERQEQEHYQPGVLLSSDGNELEPTEQTQDSIPLENQSPPAQRRLLQPSTNSFTDPEDMLSEVKNVDGGIGTFWKTYPIFIYRIQTETYKTGKSYESWLKENASSSGNSAQALADYAGQLFDFGHESRALLIYQKILHEHPVLFDKSAEALWKLAEIHLGQGNLTLADGYYVSLIEKHPAHPLAQFAKMRRVDVQILQQLDKHGGFPNTELLTSLERINTETLPELKAQVALRFAFLNQKTDPKVTMKNRDLLPTIGIEDMMKLEDASAVTESPRTSFLVSTIRLANYLRQSNSWQPELAKFAANYFETFKGKAAEPYRSNLLTETKKVLLKSLEQLQKEGQLLSAVKLYESIPRSLDQVKSSPSTSWAMAESYRNLQMPEKASPLYFAAAKGMEPGPNKFRSLFWRLETLKDQLDLMRAASKTEANQSRTLNEIQTTDRLLQQSWRDLNTSEQQKLAVEKYPKLLASLRSDVLTTIHPDILLWAWTESLSSQSTDTENEIEGWKSQYSSDKKAVNTLSSLATRFEKLGDKSKANKARGLLRFIQPKQLEGDKQANNLWAKELTDLAETYRQNNQYLEAGRLYALTGSESENWEGRAEALYKGGLLLFRSGRREEAIEAFNKAAGDGNNLLYAELAKKRLEQLQE